MNRPPSANVEGAEGQPLSGKEVKQVTIGILIDEDVITPDVLRTMQKHADKIDFDSKLEKQDWQRMAGELENERTLNSKDMDAVRQCVKQVKQKHAELHTAFRESGYNDKKIDKELEEVHLFLEQFYDVGRRYQEANAQVALQSIAGASFTPLATMSAYVAWVGHNATDMQELKSNLDGLLAGESPMVFRGNDVKPVHQEDLWKAKMQMLAEGIEKARNGEKVEIDAQYFELTSDEFVEKLATAAKAGAKVRINIDPSRPQSQVSGNSADDGPVKLRSLLQLATMRQADIGVSIYPVSEALGNLDFLMHRKLLRVGEKVLLSGMNANSGSGENVDAGVVVQGPAARRLVEIFKQDVDVSKKSYAGSIYGDNRLTAFLGDTPTLSAAGLYALLDCVTGPSDPGTRLPSNPTYDELVAKAETVNRKLEDLVDGGADLPKLIDSARRGKSKLTLKKRGRDLFATLVDRAVARTLMKENVDRLNDITLPEGKVAGNRTMALADTPTEREALMIQAISTAEKFIYVPAFVMTRAVARAVVARRDEMRSQGKELDVKVVVDPGIYGYGGTPSEQGVIELEDAGIPVRWAVLPRTDPIHDRKVHAKQIITDKLEFLGSTNLSKKGMQDNWELSGATYFEAGDPESAAHQKYAVDHFNNLWNNESIEINSVKVAENYLGDHVKTADRETRLDEARASSIRSVLRRILNFEQESATWVLQQSSRDLTVNSRVRDLEKAGMAEGYARIEALKQVMGSETFYQQLHQLPSYGSLLAYKASLGDEGGFYERFLFPGG